MSTVIQRTTGDKQQFHMLYAKSGREVLRRALCTFRPTSISNFEGSILNSASSVLGSCTTAMLQLMRCEWNYPIGKSFAARCKDATAPRITGIPSEQISKCLKLVRLLASQLSCWSLLLFDPCARMPRPLPTFAAQPCCSFIHQSNAKYHWRNVSRARA